MTARLLQPDPVAEALAGERAAQRDLQAVRDGFAHADTLLFGVADALAADGSPIRGTPRLRAYLRAIQKHIETAAGR